MFVHCIFVDPKFVLMVVFFLFYQFSRVRNLTIDYSIRDSAIYILNGNSFEIFYCLNFQSIL